MKLETNLQGKPDAKISPLTTDQKAAPSETSSKTLEDKSGRLDESLEERKLRALYRRTKGNEFMSSKQYKEAIWEYTLSLGIHEEAPTYSNRAMANLKLENYEEVVQDSNDALRLDPLFLKAHHRRGKAYMALKKYALAVFDLQKILEKEPESKDIIQDLKVAQEALSKEPPVDAQNITQQNSAISKSTNPADKQQIQPAKSDTISKQKEQAKILKESKNSELEQKLKEMDAKEQEIRRAKEQLKIIAEIAKKNADDAKVEFETAQSKQKEISAYVDQEAKGLRQLGEYIDQVVEIPEDIAEEISEQIRQHEPVAAPAPQVEPLKQPARKILIRPQTPKCNEDYAKKAQIKGKFRQISEKVESLKEEGAAEFKSGSTENAIKFYKQASQQLEQALTDLPLYCKEIFQLEAGVFNNIAFCYGKAQQHDLEIENTTEVIERALFLSDMQVLVKAYLRRGLAYEKLQQYRPACNDLYRVRELQPDNKQAQQGIDRCLKHFDQNESVKYVQIQDDLYEELPELEGVITAEQQIKNDIQKKSKPVEVAAENKFTEQIQKPVELTKEQLEIKLLDDKLTVLKERGNTLFRKQAYKQAIMNFSEAIRLFEAGGCPDSNSELKLKIVHLYYNRCLSFFHLNQHNNAISDANHILTKLDPENAKARLRRAHCYKAQEKWGEALKDFSQLQKENANDEIKKEITECLMKGVEQRKKSIQEAAEEAKRKEKDNKQPKAEESKIISDDKVQQTKQQEIKNSQDLNQKGTTKDDKRPNIIEKTEDLSVEVAKPQTFEKKSEDVKVQEIKPLLVDTPKQQELHSQVPLQDLNKNSELKIPILKQETPVQKEAQIIEVEAPKIQEQKAQLAETQFDSSEQQKSQTKQPQTVNEVQQAKVKIVSNKDLQKTKSQPQKIENSQIVASASLTKSQSSIGNVEQKISIPKSGSLFSKEFNSLKKNKQAQLNLLKEIPLTSLESYFKKMQIEWELFSDILQVSSEAVDVEWTGNLLITLSKSNNFNMTWMFAEDNEKKIIKQLIEKVPKQLSEQISSNYPLE